MERVVKWVTKWSLTAIFWVFLLSITWNGRPLFSYANEILVQNALVRTIDKELGVLWHRMSDMARQTWERDRVIEDKF